MDKQVALPTKLKMGPLRNLIEREGDREVKGVMTKWMPGIKNPLVDAMEDRNWKDVEPEA